MRLKSMPRLMSLLPLLLLWSTMLTVPSLWAQQAPLLTWGDIEVITDRDDLAPAIRAVTGLTPGQRLAMSDPRLKGACDAVRTSYPRASVVCRGIFNGEAEAMYVVELDVGHQAAMTARPCRGEASLPADLGALERSLSAKKDVLLADKAIVQKGEFVNAAQSLDSLSPDFHAIDADYAAAVAGRLAQLTAATASCDARQRADAIWFLNFAGDAHTAVRYAAQAMDDADSGVRNNAFRLLGSFAAFIDADAIPVVAQGACDAIGRVSFLDRNKGMATLLSLVYQRDFPLAALPEGCLSTVRRLAAVSHSDQIGRPARFILRRLEKTPAAAPG